MKQFPKVGEIHEGVVVKVYPNYAILLLENGYSALLHISEVTDSFIHSFSSYVNVGNIYTVKIIEVDEVSQNIKVSKRKITKEDLESVSNKQPIDPETIDFTELNNHLPKWIEKELNKGDIKWLNLTQHI